MSYHTLRRVPNNDIDPEEPAQGLQVGESRTEGTVEVRRESENLYVAECAMCGWKQQHTTPNGINWFTFTHNRIRIKEGCK